MTTPISKPDATTLLARLATPWVDLLAPKAPAGGGQAQPVVSSPRVENDVLLPTRADLHPQDAGDAQRRTQGQPLAAARVQAGTELSSTARVIMAVLAQRSTGEGRAVRGSVPLWAESRHAPQGPAMAAALSQQLSESGLFYESHLAQFAAGNRSLAQMQREPQALLGQAAASHVDEPAHAPQAHRTALLPMAPTPTPAPADALPAAALAELVEAPVMNSSMPSPEEQSPAHSAQHDETDVASTQVDYAAKSLHPATHQAAVHTSLNAYAQDVVRHADTSAAAQVAVAANGPESQLPAAIHPQASALVHQQLDMLAGAMFRWTGEAWPGVPMEWSVQEDAARKHEEEEVQLHAARWSTDVSLDLPRLGHVDLRLQLVGATVRAQFASQRGHTLQSLRSEGEELSQRMSSAGLELKSMHVDTKLAA